jgi:O-antigen/teichoic acid export membrane protein
MSESGQGGGGTLRRMGEAMPWSLASRLIRQVFGIASSILIVRTLGKFDYGVYALLVSIMGFAAAIGRGGLAEAMLRYLPELKVKEAGAAMRSLLWTVVRFEAIIGGVVLIIGWLFRVQLADLFRQPELASLMAVTMGVAFFEVYNETLTQSAIALYETMTLAIASLVASVVTLAALVALFWLDWGVVGVLVATSVGHLAGAVLLLRRILQRTRAGSQESTYSIHPRRLFNYALPFLGINVMVLITWRQSETMFLTYFWTPVEAGLFDIAYRLPQRMLEFVPGAIYPLVMAGFSEALTRDADGMRRGIVAYFKLLFALVAPISIFGMLYADRVIQVMYGSEMAAAGPLCQVFFLVFMSSFFGTPLSMAIYAVEKTWVNMLFYAVSTVIIVGLDLVMIPAYGLWGAVLPVTLITVASPFARYYLARRLVGHIVIPWGFIGRMYLASGSIALFWPLRSRINSPATLLGLCAAVAVVFYIGLKVFRVFREEERTLLERSKLPMRKIILKLV